MKKANPSYPPLRLNYVYFGLIFILLAILHGWSVILAAKLTQASPWVFVGHAIAQAGLEALVLAYVAAFLHVRKARILEGVFIAFTMMLCLVHIIDFHLVRLMDISIWHALDFVLDETWRNFLELLIASTVPFTKIFLGLLLLCLGLIGAIWFFAKSQRFIVRKKGWERFVSKPGRVLAIGFFTLGVWEYASVQALSPQDYDRYAKALPWKRGLILPAKSHVINCSLKPSMHPCEMSNKLNEQFSEAKHKPNIYLFVVETLREEFLTEEIAPHLADFRQPDRPLTFASSNGTQKSWFSIFYAQSPLYFGDMYRSGWTKGSPILEQFKRSGYKIHLYSGSRLTYYGMNEVLFGEQYALADDVYLDPPSTDRPAWQCDQSMFNQLTDDVDRYKEEQGHLFIVFIESTHFNYSWPATQKGPFTPYIEDINFLKEACFQTNMLEIQNRYRNSIHYVDDLFGRFFNALKHHGLYDNALIAITADHGEEFFEQGNLFHASALSKEQIRVPIYFHMKGFTPQTKVLSHVDILPTLMHIVFGEEKGMGILYGKSVLTERPSMFAMTGRYNGSRSPHEFILQNQEVRLHARFSNPACPAKSKSIEVLSLQNLGRLVDEVDFEKLDQIVGSSFTDLFFQK